MSSPIVDDEVKREYFLTMLHSYVNEVLDELSSIEREKPILEMISCSGEGKIFFFVRKGIIYNCTILYCNILVVLI